MSDIIPGCRKPINFKYFKYTPLHLAAMYNHNDVVLLLIDDYACW